MALDAAEDWNSMVLRRSDMYLRPDQHIREYETRLKMSLTAALGSTLTLSLLLVVIVIFGIYIAQQ